MGTFGYFEIFIILSLLYFALRGWMQKRRPMLVRKINIVLYTSLVAVILYRVMIWLRN